MGFKCSLAETSPKFVLFGRALPWACFN